MSAPVPDYDDPDLATSSDEERAAAIVAAGRFEARRFLGRDDAGARADGWTPTSLPWPVLAEDDRARWYVRRLELEAEP